jgi:RNA polymerase sigma-70 factor, ECF subfamily
MGDQDQPPIMNMNDPGASEHNKSVEEMSMLAVPAPQQPLELPVGVRPATVDAAAGLVERCQGGDGRAFRELFDRYHERVYATVYHLVSQKDEIEDVVQKVFLEVHRSIRSFEGRALFTTWLTRVAIHVARAHERKLRFFRRWLDSESAVASRQLRLVEGGLGSAPDDRLAGRERAQATRELLLKLPEKKRAVLILAEMLEMTAPEIADVLDIPPATVRTRLFYARRDFERLARRHPALADLCQHEARP